MEVGGGWSPLHFGQFTRQETVLFSLVRGFCGPEGQADQEDQCTVLLTWWFLLGLKESLGKKCGKRNVLYGIYFSGNRAIYKKYSRASEVFEIADDRK